MKKIAIAVLAILLGTATVSAAGPFLKFGAKFGVTMEKQHSDLDGMWNQLQESLNGNNMGYHAGVVLRINVPVLPIFIQGEGLYNWSKIKSEETNVNINYFSAPVMVGLGIGLGNVARIRVNAGPVFNFKTNVKFSDTDFNQIADVFKKPSVTWTAGLGVDIFGLMIDARYNGQFKTNDVTLNTFSKNIDTKPSSWSVSLGFLF